MPSYVRRTAFHSLLRPGGNVALHINKKSRRHFHKHLPNHLCYYWISIIINITYRCNAFCCNIFTTIIPLSAIINI